MSFVKPVLALAAMLAVAAGPARADTIRVGVIGPFSGPFAAFGTNFKWGIEAYTAEHGSKVGADKVEFVYRDLQGVDPTRAKALAQELIVKDKVQYLAGIYFTPNAMAVAPLLAEGKVPLVVLNAATSSITQKSPYIVRTSFTMWQNTVPAAKVALAKGYKKAAILVSDYGPGIDAEAAFKKIFTAGGGAITEDDRLPLSTTDFGPIMQRVKASGAAVVFAFLPSGPPTLGFVKAFVDNGLKQAGVQLLTTGDVLPDDDLAGLGDSTIGMMSTYHYSVAHDSPANRQFLQRVQQVGGKLDAVTMTSVAAYDGAHVIYRMIEATGGKQDPAKAVAAVEGMSWESPRGPVSIDPATRHITQNVYLRVVAKEGGRLVNKEIEVFKSQPDYGLEPNKAQ